MQEAFTGIFKVYFALKNTYVRPNAHVHVHE